MLNLHGPSCPCPKCRPPVYSRGTPLPFRYETPLVDRFVIPALDFFFGTIRYVTWPVLIGSVVWGIIWFDQQGAQRPTWQQREFDSEYRAEMARLKAQHDFNRDKGTL